MHSVANAVSRIKGNLEQILPDTILDPIAERLGLNGRTCTLSPAVTVRLAVRRFTAPRPLGTSRGETPPEAAETDDEAAERVEKSPRKPAPMNLTQRHSNLTPLPPSVKTARSRGLKARTVQHDLDQKFSKSFVKALNRKRVVARKNGFCSPNLNAFVERFIQSLRHECLDHFVVLGTKHLDHLCSDFATYYHEDRPHQSLDNEPILGGPEVMEADVIPLRSVRCHQRLGGLLKSYSRKAA